MLLVSVFAFYLLRKFTSAALKQQRQAGNATKMYLKKATTFCSRLSGITPSYSVEYWKRYHTNLRPLRGSSSIQDRDTNQQHQQQHPDLPRFSHTQHIGNDPSTKPIEITT